MISHVIVTILFFEDDNRFNNRINIYKKEVLPRIKAQTKTNFDICVVCKKKHQDIIRSIGVIPATFKDDKLNLKNLGRWGTVGENLWDNTNLKKYHIKTRLDSDDLLAPNYIEKTLEEINKLDKDKSISVTFQPRLFNLITKEDKKMRTRYSAKRCSMFSSIYKPNKEHKFLAENSHFDISKYAEQNVFVDEGYCWLGIHDKNNSTTMNS